MSRTVKLGFVTLAIVASAILLYVAASDNFFFVSLNLTSDNTVYDVRDGYEVYFYEYGNADVDAFLKVATVFYDIEQDSEDTAHITFKIAPKDKHKADSLHLEIKMLQPASALILENPETGQSPPFIYTRTDYDSYVALDFPDLDSKTSDTIIIDFWLNLLEIDPAAKDNLILGISFSIFEESVFKIIKYDARIAVNLYIPFIAQ